MNIDVYHSGDEKRPKAPFLFVDVGTRRLPYYRRTDFLEKRRALMEQWAKHVLERR